MARRRVRRLGLAEDVIRAGPTPAATQRPRHIVMRDSRARSEIGWTPSKVLPDESLTHRQVGAAGRAGALVLAGGGPRSRAPSHPPRGNRYHTGPTEPLSIT